ncbi:SDR family NAD(P)-dependent oxidoreductase [Methylobacterium sp. A54F]
MARGTLKAFPFRGSVGLVTGAAGGIGAALALGLAQRGTALVLVDRQLDGLTRTATAAERAGVAVDTHVLDLTDPAAIADLPARVAARFGRLDLLVNNAGVSLGGRFADVHLDDFEWLMDVNLRAVVRMTHAFLPMLVRAPEAQIVNLSSMFGIIAPPGQVAYATSKFAVRGFSEALRHEYVGTGLGVTVVHPGGVATNIARSARGPRPKSPETAEESRLAFEAARDAFDKLLVRRPEEAAADIIAAIERRAPRVIVGKDAQWATLIQRLLPTGYWPVIAHLTRPRR